MAEDNDNDCEDLPGVLTIVFISGSINVWTLIFAGFSVPRMSRQNYGMSTSQLLKRSELAYFLLCALHALCQIPDVLAHCYLHSTAWIIFKTTNSSTYLFHWVGAFAIFYQRLRFLFRDTPGQLHRRHDLLCTLMVTLLCTLFLILSLDDNFKVISLPRPVFLALAVVILVVLPVYAMVLGVKFIQRLYWVNKQADRDPRVISAITRYTLLAMMMMSLSMFVLFFSVAIIASHSLPDPWSYIYQHGCQSLNVLVDTMCVSLSMPMHTTYYNYLCKSCDRRCKSCCSRCSDKTSDRVVRVMAAQTSITSNSVSHPNANPISISPPISGDKYTPNINLEINLAEAMSTRSNPATVNHPSTGVYNFANGSNVNPPISPMDIEIASIPSTKKREKKEESVHLDDQLDDDKEDIERREAEAPNDDMEFPNIPPRPVLTVSSGSNIAIIH